jgi:hypothetical protein
VQIAGTMAGALSANQQAKYEAGISDQNAKLSNEQARDSITQGHEEARRYGRELGQLKGEQRNRIAGSGIDLDFGTAASIQRDTEIIGAEDYAQLSKGAYERTRGYEISAFNSRSQAAAARARGKAAIVTGVLSSVGTALGAANQISGMKRPVGAPSDKKG